jgi:hypothetical protein
MGMTNREESAPNHEGDRVVTAREPARARGITAL